MQTNIDYTSLAAVLLVGSAICAPIFALSIRLALRPVVEAWTKLKQSETGGRDIALQDRRMAVLEQEIQSLQRAVQELAEGDEFRRRLQEPAPERIDRLAAGGQDAPVA
jgi:hypothetical protein